MSEPPRRKPLLIIGLGIVLVLAIGAIALLTQGDEDAVPTTRSGDDEPAETGDADPATPSFRFRVSKRLFVETSSGRIKKRAKEAGRKAADAAANLLGDLYTEGFLDPDNWEQGRYDDAFRLFAGGASAQAKAKAAVLTAGPDAGERYDEILPISGRLTTRVLLGRAGKPTLIVTLVRFRAKALGPEPITFRSEGTFFLERVGGGWRVVSFDVTREDEAREAA